MGVLVAEIMVILTVFSHRKLHPTVIDFVCGALMRDIVFSLLPYGEVCLVSNVLNFHF